MPIGRLDTPSRQRKRGILRDAKRDASVLGIFLDEEIFRSLIVVTSIHKERETERERERERERGGGREGQFAVDRR
jgi:hypothetical protein